MDVEIVKKGIQALISDFRANYNQYKQELEANTETKLVEPLFALLGWTKNDFTKRETTRRGKKLGFGDYAFKIEGRIVFFLEVKKVGISLEKEADKQVISYALSKRIPFAISTNFEQLKIFCVEQENATSQVFRVFKSPEDYITNIQNLLLLSKESFEKNLILKEAENEGRLKKRMSMDKILLEDLMSVRKLIADDIEKSYPQKYEVNDKEEIVQRIIDRLIFIRRCEDVGINPENLYLEEVKHLPDNKAYPKLEEIFKKYNDMYNSGLFAIGKDNDCDVIKIDGLIIKKLIGYLYESKNKEYIYNFDWIDADVLGQVYEQYLGKLLQQTKSGKTKLKDGQAHKKEQGIYYTPTYVVDYIVRNTLVEALKNKKIKPEEIKILDCACGSGSFLIKAFDYLYENLSSKEEMKQQKIDSQGVYSVKTEILKRNIFGVDLDNKAVEITKLNLLLKASEKGRKLPEEVDLHIKHGNSLVNDETIDKNAFNWKGDFQEGSFDIIIGNPPYVDIKQLDPIAVRYFFDKYSTVENRMNLYAVFVERALSLLKDNGYFGFIIPNSILYNESYQKIRTLLLDKVTLRKIIRLPDNVFQDVKVETIILIYQKKKEITKEPNCEIIIYPRETTINMINEENNAQVNYFNQKIWETENNVINISTNNSLIKLLNKIEEGTKQLIDICDFSLGLTPYDKYKGHTKSQIEERVFHSKTKKNATFKPLLSGENITRYGIFWDGKEYISYGKWLGASREQRFFTKPRIVVRQIISGKPQRIYAGYTEEELYNTQIAFNIIVKDENKIYLKYLLAILNSKLINFYHKEKFLDPSKNLFQKILIANAKKFPIKILSLEKQKPIITLVDKILSLKKRLFEIGNKTTSETKELNDKIDSLNKEIDKEIYLLYGITKAEQEIIEK